jgi:hypothetical protein
MRTPRHRRRPYGLILVAVVIVGLPAAAAQGGRVEVTFSDGSDEGQPVVALGPPLGLGAINPGNSAGALVDCDSRLVGVLTAGAALPGGNGGASAWGSRSRWTPPWRANELIEHGKATHSSFGLQTVPG